jgi:alpha-L-fucosidase
MRAKSMWKAAGNTNIMSPITARQMFPLCLLLLAAGLPARAAVITWAAPVNIAADADVATNGIFNYAETWGKNGATVNGVPFAYDTSKTGDANIAIAFPGSPTGTDNHGEGVGAAGTPYASLSAACQVLVEGTVWANVGTQGTVTLNNLTVSNLYEVQIWENDSRGGYATRVATLSDSSVGGDSVSLAHCVGGTTSSANGGLGQSVIGTFTADGTSQIIYITDSATAPQTAGDQVNSIQLRNLTPSLQPTPSNTVYEATWASVDRHNPAPEWFQDAKFGIYFHFGIFSVPAYENEWYPRNMYNPGDPAFAYHQATFGNPTNSASPQFFPEYYFINGGTNLAGQFVQFAPKLVSAGGHWDPDAWAQLFVNAGARFAGPVAEHHDGFSMWASKVNPWNSVNKGPGVDMASIWATAIRARGLKFLMAMHHAYNFNGYYQYVPAQTDTNLQQLYGQLPAAQENALWLDRLEEIIDGYHPDIIYQDFDVKDVDLADRLSFLAYYYNRALDWNTEVVATYKDGFDSSGEVYDYERGGPGNILYPYWETDDAVSPSSWSYTAGMTYYPTNALIDALIDRVSKNGTMLLNISPMADGAIPQAQQNILLGIGDWLGRFGEAIYSNRCWLVYGEGPTKMGGGSFVAPIAGTNTDIRFMRNKATNTLYAIVMGWPGSQFTITSLSTQNINLATLASVQLLGNTAGTYIPLNTYTQDINGLHITMPAQPYTAVAYVAKLTFSNQIPNYLPYFLPNITWSAPTPITTADATLNQLGTIVGAASFALSAPTVTLTNGANIVFMTDNSVAYCTGAGAATGAFTGDTGNASFNTVLNGFNYDGGPKTITLANLTVGQTYSVQLFALDDRDDVSQEMLRPASFQQPNVPNDASAAFLMGNNDYVTGTFVAPPNGTNLTVNVNIQENLPTGGYGNINALVVRALPSLQLNCQMTAGGQLRLQWAQGALLGATNLSGPWLTNSTSSPFYLTPTGTRKFFRVQFQ